MFLNPKVYTPVLLCIPVSLKLSGKPSAHRNAWVSKGLFMLCSRVSHPFFPNTHAEWHNPIFNTLWKWFLIQEKGGTSLKLEFKLLPYFWLHKPKNHYFMYSVHSWLTPKLTWTCITLSLTKPHISFMEPRLMDVIPLIIANIYWMLNYLWGTVLSVLCAFSHLILTITPWEKGESPRFR